MKVLTQNIVKKGRLATIEDYPPPVGSKLRYMPGHGGNRLWHARGIVDGLSVVRSWWRRKQYWHYEILGYWDFYYKVENGDLWIEHKTEK